MSQQEESREQSEEQGDQSEEQSGKSTAEQEAEEAKEEVRQLEDNPPEKLEDWPTGAAKYETFGGPEGTHSYHEGPEQNLGPSSLRRHEGGDVEIEGEKVENPEDYKTDPIPGGPTDPEAPEDPGEKTKDESDDSSSQEDDGGKS